MLRMCIRIASVRRFSHPQHMILWRNIEIFSLFIFLIPTPDFLHFYYMLSGNLGSLLYGDVSVMDKPEFSQGLTLKRMQERDSNIRLRKGQTNLRFGSLFSITRRSLVFGTDFPSSIHIHIIYSNILIFGQTMDCMY